MDKKYSEKRVSPPEPSENAPYRFQLADVVATAAERERMVSVSARVIKVAKNSVWAETNGLSACHHCPDRQGCGVLTLTKIFRRRTNRVRVVNSMNAHVGDEVVLGIRQAVLLKQTLVVYMTPLLSMLVTTAVMNILFNSEALSVLAAGCGFVAGLFMVRLLAVRNSTSDILRPIMLSCKRVDRKMV